MLAIWVKVRVKPERVEEFHRVVAEDGRGSREDEPGCYRFDVHADADEPTTFYFYEVYADEQALAAHQAMPHFQAWAEFTRTGLAAPVEVTRTTVLLPDPEQWSRWSSKPAAG